MKALMWPVAMYGCESWTLKKDDKRRISPFEMKCFRQIFTVSRTAKRTNEWLLKTAGVTRSLLASVKERKLAYYAHMLRKKEVCLEKEIIQGSTPGTRGRPKTTWLNNITSWTDISEERSFRMHPTLAARRQDSQFEYLLLISDKCQY